MTRRSRFRAAFCLVFAVAATTAFAEIANRSPEELRNDADIIVVGTVQEIHAQRTTDELWDDQVGKVLFLVEKLEKGRGVRPGDQLKIGFWTKHWVGPSADTPPYGSGHHVPKPDPKAKIRVFIEIKDDGSYEVLLPNGFEELSPTKAAK